MIRYDSEGLYLESATTAQAKIAACDAIIDKLLILSATAADGDNIQEYSLNDGQVIIRTLYRSSKQIADAINGFEKIRQRYLARINGRVVRLVDEKNLIGRR